MQDPQEIDAIKREPLKGDHRPPNLTVLQAQKCAAILEAYADGQHLYGDYINDIAQLLKVSAVEGRIGETGFCQPSSQQLWKSIDEISWPLQGGARRQAT